MDVRADRKRRGIVATFKSVDTCAAEFEAYTPYYYSTYEDEDETPPKQPGKRRIMILGGGPNRIGQGIEFDYCCCHASFALRELGIESIMVNSNPETVSTDYDTSDLLFFEPLTTEDVLNICDRVQPDGVIVQFGGQTPLNLARALEQRRRADHRHQRRHDRRRRRPREVQQRARPAGPEAAGQRHRPQHGPGPGRGRPRSAFPVLVRPSFVLGGRAMEICYDAAQFERFVAEAFVVAQGQPVLIDRFLEDAIEVDVDAIADGEQVIVAGIMEHIEEAGVHSGDSACAIPPYSLPGPVVERDPRGDLRHGPAAASQGADEHPVRREDGGRPADRLRARSQPAGQPHGAVRVEGHRHAAGQGGGQGDGRRVAGRAGLHARADPAATSRSRRASSRSSSSPASTSCSGPEMKSTGEVMGISERFSIAFAKSQFAAGTVLPTERQDLHQRGRSRQGARGRPGPAAGADGLRAAGHQGHGRAAGRGRHPRADG